MSQTILYTTCNQVRAAAGVTQREAPDDSIIDLQVEDQLLVFLAKNVPDHAAIASAGRDPSATDDQKAKYRLLRLVSMYACAYMLLVGGQNLLFQSVESGGVTSTRFSKDDLETTIGRMAAQRDEYLADLTGSDVITNSDFVSPFTRVHPDYDPVRGC